MRKFHCLLLVLKRSYNCYYIICMTVPLIFVVIQVNLYFHLDMNEKAVCSVEANMTRLKTQILQEANDRLLIVVVAIIHV